MHRADADHGALQHGAAADHHDPAVPSSATDCRLSGTCDGPIAALSALLSQVGIMPAAAAALSEPAARPAGMVVADHVIGHFEPPDAPPPRA